MRAVMADVPQHILDQRARTGADRWDEMWRGELHMPPMPNREHQDLAKFLLIWLEAHWAAPHGNRVHQQINVASPGGWPSDYRIPDLVLLTPDRFEIDRNEYFEGAPTVAIEIHSPGDETIEKMPFYAKLGVPEVWIIDRDTKVPEVHVLRGGDYQRQAPEPDGWLRSAATGVWLRAETEHRLAVQLGDDESTKRVLPENG